MTPKPPAVLIGGPPHSGKSVLAYALTRALHNKDRAHYLYRTTPDGEGNFTQEGNQKEIQAIRVKGEYTDQFVSRINHDIKNRIFPLLVDVGGRPQPQQTQFHGHCTHAILIIAERHNDPTFYEREHRFWVKRMSQMGVPIIADLKSVQNQPPQLLSTQIPVVGSLSNLERGQTPTGKALQKIINHLLTIFTITEREMATIQFKKAPVENTVDLDQLADTLNERPNQNFKPNQLSKICDYIPTQTPLALYGRAPNWVYATLAQHSHPAPIYTFDTRLGLVQPPTLPIMPMTQLAQKRIQYGWRATIDTHPAGLLLNLYTHAQLFNIDDHHQLPLPILPNPAQGLIISGKLPNWLLMAAVRQYAQTQPWIAVYQPPIGGAAIVYTRDKKWPLGQIIPHTFTKSSSVNQKS